MAVFSLRHGPHQFADFSGLNGVKKLLSQPFALLYSHVPVIHAFIIFAIEDTKIVPVGYFFIWESFITLRTGAGGALFSIIDGSGFLHDSFLSKPSGYDAVSIVWKEHDIIAVFHEGNIHVVIYYASVSVSASLRPRYVGNAGHGYGGWNRMPGGPA